MQRSYLAYAMSVIVSRALPDARDGLKPVHRRILFGMYEAGYTPDKPYRKSARIVGDVMGKYHPHGDASIYDAAVRMAQTFSIRVPLIDGQGNFGSVDGDSPAADALHRNAPGAGCDVPAGRHRQGHRRFQPELRRKRAGTRRPAGVVSEPADQRRRGHRRRHGHANPAAQPRRDHRRGVGADRRPGDVAGRADGHRAGAGLPHRRADHRPRRHPQCVRDRARVADLARTLRVRGGAPRPPRDHHHRAALSGEQGDAAGAHRRAGARQADRRHRRHSRRERPARHARGDRAEARRHRRGGAEPAVPFHQHADQLRLQHAGTGPRPPAHHGSARLADVLCGFPRGGDPPSQPLRAVPRARAGTSISWFCRSPSPTSTR